VVPFVRMPRVPESEIAVEFARSSGPGGQNVNKASTKAVLRWNIGASRAFSEEEKNAIRARAGGRRNSADEIVLHEQSERSQARNREAAFGRLQELVRIALEPKKSRRKSGVPASERRKRLDDKRRAALKKESRRPPRET